MNLGEGVMTRPGPVGKLSFYVYAYEIRVPLSQRVDLY